MNIRIALALIAFLCFSAGCSHPPVQENAAMTSGDISYQITVVPTPPNTGAPHTGDDDVMLTMTDAATHAPIGDANVTGAADMTSPKIPGQTVSGRAKGGGVYDIPLRFPVGTQYNVVITVQRPQKPIVKIVQKVDVAQ